MIDHSICCLPKEMQLSSSIKILGVYFSEDIKMQIHVTKTITSFNKLFYTLHQIKSHGLNSESLKDVYNATVVSHLLYAACGWVGFCSKDLIAQLERVIKRGQRSGYWPKDGYDFKKMIANRDELLFKKILSNEAHVLHYLLPPVSDVKYSLCGNIHG